jgi:hypothetical protein
VQRYAGCLVVILKLALIGEVDPKRWTKNGLLFVMS